MYNIGHSEFITRYINDLYQKCVFMWYIYVKKIDKYWHIHHADFAAIISRLIDESIERKWISNYFDNQLIVSYSFY